VKNWPEKGCYNLEKLMKNPKNLFLLSILLVTAGFALALPVLAQPVSAAEPIYTPTPEENGNIYYIVKTGDTCQSIALINGVDLDTLRSYNQLNLGDCDTLPIGKKLLIGIVPTSAVTAGPTPTITPLPTARPPKGTGSICIYLYNDINGNAIAETGETALAGGQISISNTEAAFTSTASTTADDTAVCFKNISEGTYAISVAIPEGYNATTNQNFEEVLKAGDTATVNFGAQESSRINSSGGSAGSILLAVLGGLILVGGVGFGVYAYLATKKR
jgi:hypothetical protein